MSHKDPGSRYCQNNPDHSGCSTLSEISTDVGLVLDGALDAFVWTAIVGVGTIGVGLITVILAIKVNGWLVGTIGFEDSLTRGLATVDMRGKYLAKRRAKKIRKEKRIYRSNKIRSEGRADRRSHASHNRAARRYERVISGSRNPLHRD